MYVQLNNKMVYLLEYIVYNVTSIRKYCNA